MRSLVDSRERFTATAAAYHLHRPSYPPELIDWILRTAELGPSAPVADIGCGTGISTRLFAARGLGVFGVDPNEEMLAHARGAGGASYQKGEAVATGLPDRSFDLVAVGQAFHWFDVAGALREFRRVLRPGGWCAAFWNDRGPGPLMDAYNQLLNEHSADYKRIRTIDETVRVIWESPDVTSLREAEFAHAQSLDRDGLLGRAHSSSYVVHGLERREDFDRELLALFDRHQTGGRVEFLYRTVALMWQLREVSS